MKLGLKRLISKSEKKSIGIEWPPRGEPVWVRLNCCAAGIHPTNSESIAGDKFVIAAPVRPHTSQVAPPPPNTIFTVGWRHGDKSKQVEVKLVDHTTDEDATWTLEAVSQAELVQRRSYVRALWTNQVELYFMTQTVKGKIADIGEGGLRCIIPAIDEPRDLSFQVSFTLDTGPVLLTAKVAWWGEPVGDTVQIGLKFVDHEQAVRDQIRSHTFALELEERRKKF